MKFYKTAKITAKCGIVDQLDEVIMFHPALLKLRRVHIQTNVIKLEVNTDVSVSNN